MTKLEKIRKELPAAIEAYCAKKENSKSKLVTKIGRDKISAALISQMCSGNFDHISEQKILLVWDIVRPNETEIFNTEDLAAGLAACDNARQKHRMIAIEGDTGMSKSTILDIVSGEKNTYYVYIDKTVSPMVFMRELLRDMGVAFDGNAHEMLSRIAQELKTQQYPLLLIDEAAKLSDKMLLLIHSLRDRTRNNCGIVLAGMPDFRNNLIKFSNKGKTGYAEFYRRIEIWHELKGLSKKEIKYILQENNISADADNNKFSGCRRIGDLMNAIALYNELAADETTQETDVNSNPV